MSLTVEKLRNILNHMIEDDPKVAHKEVVMSQYDSERAEMDGWEPAQSVRKYLCYIIID